MAEWEKLAGYLRQVEATYQSYTEDVKLIPVLDESVTNSLNYLRDELGLDLDDPDIAHAFVSGIAAAYRHGYAMVDAMCADPEGCGTAFMIHHNQTHRSLAMPVRALARKHGIELPRG